MSHTALIDALKADDWAAITLLGWADVLRDLDAFFPGAFGPKEALPYAQLVGHHHPTIVHRAVMDAATTGKWRPGPAELATSIATNTARAVRPTLGQQEQRRIDCQPGTLALVRVLIDEGAYECGCHRLAWKSMHADGVIRCAQCGGIDPGQVDDAKEAA